MDRRDFLKTAAVVGAAAVAGVGMGKEAFAAEKYFPSKVDPQTRQ
ncbi:MAG: twin-arginine translocation signal domain-containing protein [Thermodesulfovibrionales bacterium]|nr:twin-arginine translocation signal domain-containing protein [Thermodesulfovibrionales bacterium]